MVQARVAELGMALASQGLTLGSFEMGRDGSGRLLARQRGGPGFRARRGRPQRTPRRPRQLSDGLRPRHERGGSLSRQGLVTKEHLHAQRQPTRPHGSPRSQRRPHPGQQQAGQGRVPEAADGPAGQPGSDVARRTARRSSPSWPRSPSLELQQNANTSLESLLIAQASANQTSMTNFVGKDVIYRTDHITPGGRASRPWPRRGWRATAEKVTAVITDAQRQDGAHHPAGAKHAAGAIEISWDGRDDHGNQLPPGSYKLRVTARGQGRRQRGRRTAGQRPRHVAWPSRMAWPSCRSATAPR